MRRNGRTYTPAQRRRQRRQPLGNRRDERARRLELAAAAREEEAAGRLAGVEAFPRHGARNGRLARPSHAVQPVYTFTATAASSAAAAAVAVAAANGVTARLAARPRHDLLQDLHARVGQTKRVGAVAVVVECRMLGVRELFERIPIFGGG